MKRMSKKFEKRFRQHIRLTALAEIRSFQENGKGDQDSVKLALCLYQNLK